MSKQAHILGEASKTDPHGAEKGQCGPFGHVGRQDMFVLSSVSEEQESTFATRKMTRFWESVASLCARNNP